MPRADLRDCLVDLVDEPVQCRAGIGVAAALEAVRGDREPDPQSGQPLLNPVVEVSPDSLAVSVTGHT
jgi:hypothetical protein